MRTAVRSTTFFVLSAFTVVALCAVILRSRLFATNPDLAAFGVTFDLTITIPLLYWLFVVRGGKASPLTSRRCSSAGHSSPRCSCRARTSSSSRN